MGLRRIWIVYTVAALAEALRCWYGAVLVVSHDAISVRWVVETEGGRMLV